MRGLRVGSRLLWVAAISVALSACPEDAVQPDASIALDAVVDSAADGNAETAPDMAADESSLETTPVDVAADGPADAAPDTATDTGADMVAMDALADADAPDASADIQADTAADVAAQDASTADQSGTPDADVVADAGADTAPETLADAGPVDPAVALIGAWKAVGFVDNGNYEAIPADQTLIHVFRSDGTLLYATCDPTNWLDWSLVNGGNVIKVDLPGGSVVYWDILVLTPTTFQFGEGNDEFHFEKTTCP